MELSSGQDRWLREAAARKGVEPAEYARRLIERSCGRSRETLLNLHIEALPEGGVMTTSEDLPGLVAQGRTVADLVQSEDACWKTLSPEEWRKQTLE